MTKSTKVILVISLMLIGFLGGTLFEAQTREYRALAAPGDNVFPEPSGNVGIGTDNPQQLLHIAGATPRIYLQDDNSQGAQTFALVSFQDQNLTQKGYFGLDTPSQDRMALFGDGSTSLVFGAGGADRMTLDTSGNVGIGTSSPQQKLHVASPSPRVYVQDNNSEGANTLALVSFQDRNLIQKGYFGLDTPSQDRMALFGDGSTFLVFGSGGADRMTITTSGNVGIGNSSPSERLQVQGNIKLSGASPKITADGEICIGSGC